MELSKAPKTTPSIPERIFGIIKRAASVLAYILTMLSAASPRTHAFFGHSFDPWWDFQLPLGKRLLKATTVIFGPLVFILALFTVVALLLMLFAFL